MKKILYLFLVVFSLTMLTACGANKENNPQTIDVSMVTFVGKEVTYDGQIHKVECQNVPAGVTPLYIGNGQSEVGNYTVVVKLIEDSTRTVLKELETYLIILPKTGENPDDGNDDDEDLIDVSNVVFGTKKVTYDGNTHRIDATNLPEGVTPKYEGNDKKEVGIYIVTCKLYDAKNNLLATLYATLEIVEPEEQTDPNDISKVIFANKTVTHDGNAHSITASNIPSGVTPEYEGNGKIEVGTYTVTCKLYDAEGNVLATLTATLKINNPVDVQLPLV